MFAALVKFKGVGEANAFEREVTRQVDRIFQLFDALLPDFPAEGTVESVFDIDGGDVIGEQDEFVGVEFVLIFALQIFGLNQSAQHFYRRACGGNFS